jgi:O-antigen ligase
VEEPGGKRAAPRNRHIKAFEMFAKLEIGRQSHDMFRLRTKPASLPSELPGSRLSLTARSALVLIAIAALLAIWYVAQKYDIEPYVPLLALLALAAAMVATRRFAGVLLAGLLYVGNFKTISAVGVSLTDPTFIVLMLCAAGFFLECLFIFSEAERGSILRLFHGQGRGVLLFVLFILMIAVSELYTAAPESGLLKVERIAVFSTLAFFAPFVFFRRPKDLNQFLVACVVLSSVLALRNLLYLLYPTESILSGHKDITRIGDGELIGTTLVILIYHRFSERHSLLRSVCIPILAVGLVASAARSAALSLLLIIVLTSILMRSRPILSVSRRAVFGIVLAAIVATGAAFAIRQLPAAQMKFAHKADELSELLQGSFLPGGTAEQRMDFYKQALVAIGEKPVLGWGVGGWGVFFLGTDQKAIPHNFILESAVEQGVIGSGLLLSLLLTTGMALRKAVRRGGAFFVFLLPVFLLTILYNLVTGELESRGLWFWCGTVLAVSRMIQDQIQRQRFNAGATR